MQIKPVLAICGHSFIRSLIGEDAVVVDLGANKGEFSYAISDTFRCNVYAVEPVPDLFLRIERRPKLQKMQYCVSGKEGKVVLSLSSDRCATTYSAGYSIGEEKTLVVKSITLDKLMDSLGLRKVDLLKVDIEGAEIDMFTSVSAKELRRFAQITVEFHDFLYPELHTRVEKTKRELVSAGFYCVPFSLNNGDVLFVRNDMISLVFYLYLKYFLKYILGASRRMKKLTR